MSEFLHEILVCLVCVVIAGIAFFLILGSASLCCERITPNHHEISKVECFSTSEYLEEIEKVHLSILEEQENREPYIITLWWGLDGIRLGEDGKPEWISRREKPKANSNSGVFGNTIYFHSPYLTYPTMQWNGMAQSVDAGIQNMTNGINSNIQSQIESIRRLQFQAAQMAQNAYIHNIHVGRDLSGRIIRR